MKKRVLSLGVAIPMLLLPTTVYPARIQATAGGSGALSAQVLHDLQNARDHAVSPNQLQRDHADEWSRMGNVISEEQVKGKELPTSALDMIEATKAWHEDGVRGEGMLVSVVDTGINQGHPDMPNPRDKRLAVQKSGSPQKIIPGYNWADKNLLTNDVGSSQHGMHVAGIIAANGKVKGVAPEAQLLSQKVFSNYQGDTSSFSESILFAINDSIAKKADVINLSLGSSAGYVDDASAEQFAIKKAVDNGVIVVAAAGNDGSFGSDKILDSNPDVAMIGSPGLAPDAFSVASANSTMLAGLSFAVNGVSHVGRVVYFVGQPSNGAPLNPTQALARSHELIYVGKGKKEDYNISTKGKVVLIERGDITFEEKLRLAKEAGAAGVIIYNNQQGPLLISANEAKNIPAVSILKETGEKIAEAVKKGSRVTISFDGQYGENALPFPNGGTISSFSSWGPTPNLQFKPEITAPGGGILSTVLDHEYAVKSGTSMATPHVAGGMALLKQAYQKQGRKLQGRALVETLKAAAMNTAEPILDPREIAHVSVGEKNQVKPYSPRVQGAGMLQVAKAAKTPVIVTDTNGKGGLSLGEIGTKTSFTLLVQNKFGKKPLTYQLRDAFGIMTDLHLEGVNRLSEVPLAGAKLQFSPERVTVPPGTQMAVKVTLIIPEETKRNVFADGFIQLKPEATDLPTLHVPFYGFFGDWDEPRIMDAPMWEEGSQEKRTGVKTTWYQDKENDKWKYRDYLGVTGVTEHAGVKIDPTHIAFSPNGDGHYDIAAPSITFLRNAKQLTIDVVDRAGNLVRSLVKDEKVTKYDQSKLGIGYYYTEKKEWGWDGKAFSTAKGEYLPVPDGTYQFVIRARIDERNSSWQTLTLPITVDREAPRVTAYLDGNRINWTSKDKDVQGYLLYVDGKKVGGPYSATETGTYVSKPHNRLMLVAYDYAGNITTINLNGKSDSTPPLVLFPDNLYRQLIVSQQQHVPIRGRISGEDLLDRVKLTINKAPVKVEEDGTFQTILDFPEGLHYVEYSATDAFGNNRSFTQRIIVDKTPPLVSLVNDGTEEIIFDSATKKMLLPIRFQYSDITYKGEVSLNGQIVSSWEEDQLEKPVHKDFIQFISLPPGDHRLLIEGKDEAGNIAKLPVHAYVDTYGGNLVLFREEQRINYKGKPLPQPSVAFAKASYVAPAGEQLTVRGKVTGAAPLSLKFYYGEKELAADWNEQGAFRLTIPAIQAGKEKCTVVAVDALGRQVKKELSVTGKR